MIIAGYRGSHTKIDRCISEANKLLKGDYRFYEKIKAKPTPFDMSTATPKQIAEFLQENYGVLKCEVHLYHKKFTRALAYFDRRYPNRIYINTAKLNRTDGSVIATIVHEWVHLVDEWIKNHRFGHGDNSAAGKQNTAPYWIDNVAQAIVDNKPEDHTNNESSRIVYRRSVWSRVKRFFRRIF